LRQADEALCKALGPVSGLFEQGTAEGGHPLDRMDAFYTRLPLRADIKGLSAAVMEALLGSDKLQLRSENDAYYLLCAWLSQSERISDEGSRRTFFKRVFPQLRFHHMTEDFFGAFLSACPYTRSLDSDFLLDNLMSRSVARRTLPLILPDSQRKTIKMGEKDRSTHNLMCTFVSRFDLLDLLPLKKAPGQRVHKFIGLASGFPVAVSVQREGKGTMGLYVFLGMPRGKGRAERAIEDHAGFLVRLEAGGVGKTMANMFQGNGWGWQDFLGMPWEEIVYENSPYFPNGVITVGLTMDSIGRFG